MSTVRLDAYMAELTHQTTYATFAVDALNRAYTLPPDLEAPADLAPAFAASQNLLTAAALTSKLLWSSGGRRARTRSRLLREALDVLDSEFSVLRNRTVRDSLEHVDERLDAYLAREYHREPFWFERHGPHEVVHRDYSYVRRLLPRRRVIAVLGRRGEFDEVSFPALAEEMGEVQKRVNRWLNDEMAAMSETGAPRTGDPRDGW